MPVSAVNKEIVEMEELLHVVGLLLQRRTRNMARSCDLTPQQAEALLVLKRSGPLTMGEVCKALDFACSTATDMFDRLEVNGFVERVRNHRDRRSVLVQLTSAGEQHVKLFMDKNLEQIFEIFSKNNPQQNRAIIDALGQIKVAMSV